ncbi:hypothetical protein EB151_07615, partial [archaeon]|nr:hypothetical protein [archaeon]
TAKDYQDLVLSFVLTISDVSFNFDLDRFCCEIIDRWGSFDFGGYISDENNNVFNGPVSISWDLEGPDAQDNYMLDWYYDNNNGYINVNLWYDNMGDPNLEPTPGNYTLNVEIMLEGMGSIPLSFDFERTEFQGPPPVFFEFDYVSDIVLNEDPFKASGFILDEFNNPFAGIETQFFSVWYITPNNQTEQISLSDHDSGNRQDVTYNYDLDFSYESSDGYANLALNLINSTTIIEGFYELQMEVYKFNIYRYQFNIYRYQFNICK